MTQQMRRSLSSLSLTLTTSLLLLVGCGNSPETTAAATSVPIAECQESGRVQAESIQFIDQSESHSFSVYLPPCYVEGTDATYPVLYWTAGDGQFIFDAADQLIQHGDIPPAIIICVNIDMNEGLGADKRIVEQVVPYIESKYPTRSDRIHRSVTGISHGAAIAARTSFQAPQLFGRVAILSGGITAAEQDKFTQWIQATTSEQWPKVLIDVGDQDGILSLTRQLTDVLDQQGVPYTFTHAAGGHEFVYWQAHIAEYLKWLIPKE